VNQPEGERARAEQARERNGKGAQKP